MPPAQTRSVRVLFANRSGCRDRSNPLVLLWVEFGYKLNHLSQVTLPAILLKVLAPIIPPFPPNP